MGENYTNKHDTMHELKEMIETELKDLLSIGIQEDNIDNLSKLIDIHKDLENEEYWKYKKMKHSDSNQEKEIISNNTQKEKCRNLERKMQEMMEHCENYSSAVNAMSRGDYEAAEISMRSLRYMLESACQFMDMLARESKSSEEMQLIRKYARKIGDMF